MIIKNRLRPRTERLFWRYIEDSKVGTNNFDEQYQKLLSILAQSNPIYIFGFEIILSEKIDKIFKPKVATYLVKIFLLDDETLMGFAGWVIFKGKTFYETFLNNADSVAKEISEGNEVLFGDIEFPITHITNEAYMLKNNIPSEIAYDEYILPGEVILYFHERPTFPNYSDLTDEEYIKLYPNTAKIINGRNGIKKIKFPT